MNLPNKLSILRILMVPLFVLAYFLPFEWTPFVALGIFVLAAITDFLDGFIARKYNLDYINLGFSGNGRAELPIVNYMATLPMLAFVSDYDHNAPNAEYLRETHFRMYEIIREAHPDIPYIMVSRPDCLNSTSAYDRKTVIIDSFREARERGDKNVYFVDGEGMFRGPYEDSCTVDGCHPNDLGMMKMADAIGRMLERSLRGNPIFKEV